MESGSSSTIVMVKLTSRLKHKEAAKTTWETQAGKFTTSNKVNVYFCLLEFSATKIVTWKCQMDESNNFRYDIILGRDLIPTLGRDIKYTRSSITDGEGPYEGCSAQARVFMTWPFILYNYGRFYNVRCLLPSILTNSETYQPIIWKIGTCMHLQSWVGVPYSK